MGVSTRDREGSSSTAGQERGTRPLKLDDTAMTGQTEEWGILNRRGKSQPERGSHSKTGLAMLGGSKRLLQRGASFSVLGIRGTQASEENMKRAEATRPATISLAQCKVPINNYVV